MPFFPGAAWVAIPAILAEGARLNETIRSGTCAQCGKAGARWKCEVIGPDDSWECYRYWCNTACHANWGTNQPVRDRF